MGALTSNRKRSDDYFASHPINSELRIDTHISKKLKFSPSVQNSVTDLPVSSKSSAVRVHQYPEKVSRFKREVHAPCRVTRFGSCRVSSGEVSNSKNSAEVGMGNLISNYAKTMSEAFSSLRFWRKDKDVIDVGDGEEKGRETVKNDGVEDLSVEEVEIVMHGKETWREDDGMELDEKIGEPNFQPSCSSVISEDLTNANLKLDSVDKVLDTVSMDRELDASGIPLHKKLLYSANKRNEKLRRLQFDIDLNQRLRSIFQLLRPAKKEDVVKEPFVPLTKEEESEVTRALSSAKRRRVLVTHVNSNIEITGELLQCLQPGAWLNDEVINLYLELLKERETREPHKFLKCHFFNTFFYKKLIGGRSGYDFKSVRRWTTQKKLGYCLLECDKIFVPIHKEIHWCLAVINKKDEKFQYLDSLRGFDKHAMKVLARYFVEEVKDKSGEEIDVSSWKQECVEDLPEQENGFDCGMFMIKYCDFYSRDVGLCFNQVHMPYFRRRTAKEILRLKAE